MTDIHSLPKIDNGSNVYYDTNLNYDIPKDVYFVFGSNIHGVHGRGAALTARKHFGAKLGIGVGYSGMSYAIPTKATPYQTLPLLIISQYIQEFIKETQTTDKRFYLTPIGTGLAGYRVDEIAPLFKGVKNCYIPSTFRPYLEEPNSVGQC